MIRFARKHPTLYGGSWLLGLATATTVPERPLTDYPFLEGLASILAHIVPTLDKISTFSAFPEVTTLFFSVQWLIVPAYVLTMARSMLRRDGLLLRPEAPGYLDDLTLGACWRAGAVTIVCAVLAVYAFAFDDGRDIFGTRFNTSRLFLGIFGMAMPLVFSLALAYITFQMRTVYARFFVNASQI
jgi:hypothetical protein